MELSHPHSAPVRPHLPRREYRIAFDRYDRMTHMGKTIDHMRKNEQQVLYLARTKEKQHGPCRQEVTESSYGIGKELGI